MKMAGKIDGCDFLEARAPGKNVPSPARHRFIVIHDSARARDRRKRNLIRSDATSVRHLKLQPDLQILETWRARESGRAGKRASTRRA